MSKGCLTSHKTAEPNTTTGWLVSVLSQRNERNQDFSKSETFKNVDYLESKNSESREMRGLESSDGFGDLKNVFFGVLPAYSCIWIIIIINI